mgnify:CR=1 FL=1
MLFADKSFIADMTAKMMLEVKAVHFSQDKPFVFTSGWASPVYIDVRKLISYPRTDSRYLGGDMRAEIPGILENLRAIRPDEIGKLDLGALTFTGRIINDAKVGDHHAIIPTGKPPAAVSSSRREQAHS